VIPKSMTARVSQLGFVCLMVALLLPDPAALEISRGRVEDAAMEEPGERAGDENQCPLPLCVGTVVVCIPVCISPSESLYALPFALICLPDEGQGGRKSAPPPHLMPCWADDACCRCLVKLDPSLDCCPCFFRRDDSFQSVCAAGTCTLSGTPLMPDEGVGEPGRLRVTRM
jgi:hypothetical protein